MLLPARLACQPLQLGNTKYTIVDDDVEVTPIYRHDGKVFQPTRPHENHWPGYRAFTYMDGESM